HRNIGLAPPDGVASLFVLNNELVLGAATRVLAGRDNERTVLGEEPFAMTHCFLDKLRCAPVFGHVRARLDGFATDHHLGHVLAFPFFAGPLHTYATPAAQKGRPAS